MLESGSLETKQGKLRKHTRLTDVPEEATVDNISNYLENSFEEAKIERKASNAEQLGIGGKNKKEKTKDKAKREKDKKKKNDKGKKGSGNCDNYCTIF